jgi:Zn-dependent peptidase ImmA (M78 family)
MDETRPNDPRPLKGALMEENTAILRAREFLKLHGTPSLPVDVMELAAAEGFEVLFKDLAEGEAGSTVERRGQRFIWVNEHDPDFRQRFTVLHEIAHHVLGLPSVHGQVSLPLDEALATPRRRPQEEVACDAFASECLVPHTLLKPRADSSAFTVLSVSQMSALFRASQHCIASQWIKASDETLAFVIAKDRRIEWAFPTKNARDAGLRIPNGRSLPANSAADRLVRTGSSDVASSELEASEWSLADTASRFVVYEEATNYVPMQRTYSFLTFEEVDAARHEEGRNTSVDQDSALLEALTGELRWRK